MSEAAAPLSSAATIAMVADDYGMAPGIDAAVLRLAERGRLNAISCMSVVDRWPEAAAGLKGLPVAVSVGLHFTLTALPVPAAALGQAPDLGRLLIRAMSARIDWAAIADALADQLERFESVLGRPPAHLDGHQHVHALPGVAELVRDVIGDRYGGAAPWLRICGPVLPGPVTPGASARRGFIGWLGRRQRQVLAGSGLAGNALFGGIRSFRETQPYEDLVAGQLAGAPSGTLFMCHPALPGQEIDRDPIAAARAQEYAFLASDAFTGLLDRLGKQLGPLAPQPVGRSSR